MQRRLKGKKNQGRRTKGEDGKGRGKQSEINMKIEEEMKRFKVKASSVASDLSPLSVI